MQVILQEDVVKLGKAGEVVTVREGYGRNYLLPQKKAVLAVPGNLKELEHQKRTVAAKQEKVKKAAGELAEKLKALSITIGREIGEEDRLFGSVTTKDISDALRNEGFVIDRRDIHLEEPIKQLGIFDIPVKLHSEVTGVVKVWVVKK
ncbi:MAG: 50S ribosomal protein L9 [Pseudomonadota bacterium]